MTGLLALIHYLQFAVLTVQRVLTNSQAILGSHEQQSLMLQGKQDCT